ncbi:MAG: hypothetical protein IT431_04985 [Phycisphaerales bacterium]|nr:hypothetical protein [Phycisphaerales bacterium]
MSFGTIRYTNDDAGVRRRMVLPRLRGVVRRSVPRVRGRALDARWELGRSERWRLWPFAAFAAFNAVMCYRAAGRNGSSEHWSWDKPGIFVVSGVFVLLVVAVCWWFGSMIGDKHLRRVLLEHDLCPSCGGDLAGETPDRETGRVRCACGAEWWSGEALLGAGETEGVEKGRGGG